MGLLDEAIRDHLELKRRRGADHCEIAREEREALDPVFPDEPRPAALADEPQAQVSDPGPPQGDPLVEAAAETPLASEPPPGRESAPHSDSPPHSDPPPGSNPPLGPDLSVIGLETAELDMEAVLQQDERLARERAAAHDAAAHDAAAPAHATAHAEGVIEDELLEWESAEHAYEPPPEPLPGQERLSFE